MIDIGPCKTFFNYLSNFHWLVCISELLISSYSYQILKYFGNIGNIGNMKHFADPLIKCLLFFYFMVSVSFGIGRKLRPIFSFGFSIGPKPKRWFRSYTSLGTYL